MCSLGMDTYWKRLRPGTDGILPRTESTLLLASAASSASWRVRGVATGDSRQWRSRLLRSLRVASKRSGCKGKARKASMVAAGWGAAVPAAAAVSKRQRRLPELRVVVSRQAPPLTWTSPKASAFRGSLGWRPPRRPPARPPANPALTISARSASATTCRRPGGIRPRAREVAKSVGVCRHEAWS